jgi:alkylated DNA nucleotide flippase Atl1
MASTRAPAVAEILWELKRLDRIAKFSAIAERAGFSAGANGRAMMTCLKTVRKDWPHLQWWRAIRDDGTVKKGGEQANELKNWGVEFTEDLEEGRVGVLVDESRLMVWAETTIRTKSAVSSSATGDE